MDHLKLQKIVSGTLVYYKGTYTAPFRLPRKLRPEYRETVQKITAETSAFALPVVNKPESTDK